MIDMKMMFLHIGDLHIGKTTNICHDKIKKLAETLNEYNEIDEISIICTGDLANTANKDEYKKVKYFFSTLCKELAKVKDSFVKVYFVPGNHDIEIVDSSYILDEINHVNFIRQGEKMINYFNFLNDWYNKRKFPFASFYDITHYDYRVKDENICIGFNMINTAPFSLKEHVDKEMHFVCPESFKNFSNNADINITMMHHSYEWFHESVKEDLKNYIFTNTDILFNGHTHVSEVECTESSDFNRMIVSNCGAFDVDSYYNNTFFNLICYDNQTNYISAFTYSWDKNEKMFTKKVSMEKEKFKKGTYCRYDECFLKEIRKDEKNNIGKTINEYFVFPELRDCSNDVSIEDMERLVRFIVEHKYVSINGKRESGKTTLLKMLYLRLKEEKLTLFLNVKDFEGKSINRVINSAICTQLSEKNNKDKFRQVAKKYKAIIIDDFDLIKNDQIKQKVIEYLKKDFDNIIFVTSKDLSLTVKDDFKEKYLLDIDIINISSFTERQRLQLIEKLSLLNFKELDKDITFEIEKNIKNTPILKNMGNTFILNFIHMSINQGNIFSNDSRQSFNTLFETTLRRLIIENTKKDNIETYLMILQILAYNVHKNKFQLISSKYINDIIDEYNIDYGKNVSENDFKNSMKQAYILKEISSNQYVFVNKMYLAYFIAKHICYKISNEDDYDDFSYILKHICFGINDDILLFIIYISQKLRLLRYIYETINRISKEWDQLSFEKKNIKFIYNIKQVSKIDKISNEKLEEVKESKINSEITMLDEYNISCEGLYDYDDSSVNEEINQLTCVLKGLELLSRGLESFNATLKLKDQKEVIEGIYSITNRLLYKLLKEFDNDFDEFINYLCEESSYEDSEKLRRLFVYFILRFISSVYERITSLCTDSQTISAINDVFNCKEYDNIDGKLFMLNVINCTNNDRKFIDYFTEILKRWNDPCVMFIIRYIILDRILQRNILSSKRTRMIDKYNENVNSYVISNKEVMIRDLKYKKIKQLQ